MSGLPSNHHLPVRPDPYTLIVPGGVRYLETSDDVSCVNYDPLHVDTGGGAIGDTNGEDRSSWRRREAKWNVIQSIKGVYREEGMQLSICAVPTHPTSYQRPDIHVLKIESSIRTGTSGGCYLQSYNYGRVHQSYLAS